MGVELGPELREMPAAFGPPGLVTGCKGPIFCPHRLQRAVTNTQADHIPKPSDVSAESGQKNINEFLKLSEERPVPKRPPLGMLKAIKTSD